MKRISSVLLVAALMVAMLSVGAGSAFAKSDRAVENCEDNIDKQEERGLLGSETGSAKDKKQQDEAVTNCDQFWN
jgi:hypothetical protein